MSKILPAICMLLMAISLYPTILLADSESNCSPYSNVEQNNIKFIKSMLANLWEAGKNEADFSRIYSKILFFMVMDLQKITPNSKII